MKHIQFSFSLPFRKLCFPIALIVGLSLASNFVNAQNPGDIRGIEPYLDLYDDQNMYLWQDEAYNDGLPLAENRPLIFYLYRQEQQVKAVGVSFGYPNDIPSQEIKAMKNMTGSLVGTLSAN